MKLRIAVTDFCVIGPWCSRKPPSAVAVRAISLILTVGDLQETMQFALKAETSFPTEETRIPHRTKRPTQKNASLPRPIQAGHVQGSDPKRFALGEQIIARDDHCVE